ncbi:MAG: hypothetical protein GY757_61020, partial [bacterium]|nr:hypothetical protein [bacterium]
MNNKKRERWLLTVKVLLFGILIAGGPLLSSQNGGTGHLSAAGIPVILPDDDGKNENIIKQFAGEREKKLKALSQLNISASASFNGNTSGERNLYQLGLGVAVSKEMYPGEFNFRTNTSLVIQDSVLKENVTTMSMSYEHYLSSWLETYGFMERVSNTFLRLRYRYEIGGGFKGEFNLAPNKWKKNKDNPSQIQGQYDKYIRFLQKLTEKKKNRDNESEIRD